MSRLSVIVPARNASPFLREALDSIFEQGIEEPEVVVVDDGSTDGTGAVARNYGRGVRTITLPPSGSARARNEGLAASGGELVAFLDADDLWTPDKTGRQLALLEADPGLGFVFSDMRDFDASGPRPRTWFEACGFEGRCTAGALFLHDMVSTPTVIARRSFLDEAGRFDERLPIGQDTDLWFRLALRFPFAFVGRPLVRRRLHSGNVTRDERLLARCVVEVWGRYLAACIGREPEAARRLKRDFARKVSHHHFLEACALRLEGRRREARGHLIRSLQADPSRVAAWPLLIATLVLPDRRRKRQGRSA